MTSRDTLMAEADAMDRLAAVVSYAPDKRRLARLAAELRQRAGAPADPPRPAAGPDRGA